MIDVHKLYQNELVYIAARKTVQAGAVLVNRPGTAKKSPKCPNCGAWIAHWEKLSGQTRPDAGQCPVLKCKGKTDGGKDAEIFGCHVQVKGLTDDKVYIAPLCQCCNNAPDGTEFVLKQPLILVRANVAETCGKLQ